MKTHSEQMIHSVNSRDMKQLVVLEGVFKMTGGHTPPGAYIR